MFLSWLTGTDGLPRLRPLCACPLALHPSSIPKVWRLREDMSVLHTWALWRMYVIGLLFLIDKVMRLLDWTLLRSFHSTEWGLLSARTVRYFFLSVEHSPALLPLCGLRFVQGKHQRSVFCCDVSTLFEFLQGVIPVLRGSGVLQNLTLLIYFAYPAERSLTHLTVGRYLSRIVKGMSVGEYI